MCNSTGWLNPARFPFRSTISRLTTLYSRGYLSPGEASNQLTPTAERRTKLADPHDDIDQLPRPAGPPETDPRCVTQLAHGRPAAGIIGLAATAGTANTASNPTALTADSSSEAPGRAGRETPRFIVATTFCKNLPLT